VDLPVLLHRGIVPLSFSTRRVGDVTIVTCRGRIVEGAESAALYRCVNPQLELHPLVLLDLGGVEFIDSSGLGLLVRLLMRLRNAGGDLKVCGLSPAVDTALKTTRLDKELESHPSEAEAIAAFYRRRNVIETESLRAVVLCVAKSDDLLAYVREVLRQGGYSVLTTTNLADAQTLLTAASPKLVVIDSAFHPDSTDTALGARFSALTKAMPVVELPAGFSGTDAGDAGRQLLDRVRTLVPPAHSTASHES
jgi:anti-sigma B factor antagonist